MNCVSCLLLELFPMRAPSVPQVRRTAHCKCRRDGALT